MGSRLGRSSWRKRPPGCGWGWAAAEQDLLLYLTPSLQRVSKSLPGDSPPATIIANVDVLIG